MADLSAFPVTRQFPPQHPDRLQLYSLPTPNGVKVSIMLEELGLPYEVHLVDISKDETWTPEFLSLNPNGKIPAIIDPDGPGGKPLPLFESGAILVYLAEKSGRFLPTDPAARYETLQWVFFQMAAIGPMFGQVGFFHKYAGSAFEDKRPRDRYVAESRRLLGVLEGRLKDRQWIMGDDYTIADMAAYPWINVYDKAPIDLSPFAEVRRWHASIAERPATQRAYALAKQVNPNAGQPMSEEEKKVLFGRR